MPQQLDDLIFDRTQSDVSRVQSLTQKMIAGTATEAEKSEWLGGMKGAYNASDLNRVLSAVEYLTDMLYDMGYNVSTIMPEKKTQYIAKEIEYIESTGKQYIDTGFKPNQDTRLTMDVEVLSQNSYPKALFGGRNGDTSTIDAFVCWIFGASNIRADYGNTNHSFSVSTPGRFTIEINKNSASVDSSSFTFSSSTFQSLYNLALFSQNDVGGIDTRMASIRLYSCKIYDNGTLVRDYKPYYDSNGVACLYDAVNGAYYYNAGTGNFSASEPPETKSAYYVETDIPTQTQMDVYIENIHTLRNYLPYVAPDAPESAIGLDYQRANDIEEILYILEQVLIAMQENFKLRQANTFFMTAGGVLQ